METHQPPDPDSLALTFGLFVPLAVPPDPAPPGRWLFLCGRHIVHEVHTLVPLPRRVFNTVCESTLRLRPEHEEEARHVAARN
jgi:hypothetical protein